MSRELVEARTTKTRGYSDLNLPEHARDSRSGPDAVCLRLAATRLSRRGGAETLPGAELSFYFAAAAQLEPALVPRSQSASSDARRSGARRRRPCSPPSTHR